MLTVLAMSLGTLVALMLLFFVIYMISRVQMAGWLSVVEEFIKKHQETNHEEKSKQVSKSSSE